MQCILCEKPSAAANYAKALGGKKGNFNNKDYIIVNSVGHIFEFKQPENNVSNVLSDKYKSWDLSNLPWNRSDILWNKQLCKDKKDVYNNIKAVMEDADEIVIATDNDPTGEGTLLADEIILSMNLSNKHYYRSFHIDESEKEIQKAMLNLKDLGSDVTLDPDYQKALFRSKWDYLSMQWTRLFTQKAGTLLRQGRLKSYIVLLVGKQLDLIKNYQKIPYYEVKYKDDKGNLFTNPDSTKHQTKEAAFEESKQFLESEVIKESEEVKYKAPPQLYNLNMLSGVLAPKGFTAKQVLDTYQKMYDNQIVSYPRTEDKKISPEQFKEFVELAPSIAKAIGIDPSILSHTEARKTHVEVGGSHGANRPSNKVPSSLEDLKKEYGECGAAIYDLLARNSLAMLCEDYEYNQIKGSIKDNPSFKTTINILLSNGYKEIFNDEEDKKEVVSKELGTIAKPVIAEGFPKKPVSPTAKWLAKQLEKNDVGTGATRTSIYAEMTNSNSKNPLLSESKGKISMTEYGNTSYKLLIDTHIGDVKLTEKVQSQMKDVSSNPSLADKYLDDIASLIKEDITIVDNNLKKNNISAANFGPKPSGKCPICGADVMEYSTSKGLVWKCNNNNLVEPKCTFILYSSVKYFDNNLKITSDKAIKLIQGDAVSFKIKSKNGKSYDSMFRIKINGKYTNLEKTNYKA